jgi:heme-degrading monooxygenase HmoA
MFVLNVELNLKSGSEQALETTFKTIFVPAVSQQEGFVRTELLRPTDVGANYRLFLGFSTQPLQQQWVAQPLHQEVWPQMEAYFDKYSVLTYNTV